MWWASQIIRIFSMRVMCVYAFITLNPTLCFYYNEFNVVWLILMKWTSNYHTCSCDIYNIIVGEELGRRSFAWGFQETWLLSFPHHQRFAFAVLPHLSPHFVLFLHPPSLFYFRVLSLADISLLNIYTRSSLLLLYNLITPHLFFPLTLVLNIDLHVNLRVS